MRAAPLASTTPRLPLTLHSFSPARVPAGGVASGRRSSDPSGDSAKIVDPHTLRVPLVSGGEETVQFEHAILATGSLPAVPTHAP